jgi:intraflagellar transport protein 81
MLEEKAKTAQNPAQDKLAIYKQQAAMASKKKEKTLETLQQLETDGSKLEKRMSAKEQEYEKARGGNKFMGRDEFQKYAQSLRAKTNTFKQMKSQLATIRTELAILDRTEKLLKQKNKVLEDAVRNMERKQGIEGYTSIQSGVEEVSKMQQEINLKKGATLEEMSRTVEQVNQMKEQKKAQLAPLIQERKTLYAKYQEVSTEYEAKKAAYERANAFVESERMRLEEETKRLTEETTALESKYHFLNCKLQLDDALLQRATNEQSFQSGEKRMGAQTKSIKEVYQARMTDQQNLSNDMRKNQKIIKETSEVNSRQVKLFNDLRRILQLKSRLVKQDVQATGVARNMLRGRDLGGEVGVGGVNRLVIGD